MKFVTCNELFCKHFRTFHFRKDGWMKIEDDLLEKLGVFFVYHDLYNRYGITFENFVYRYLRGNLEL